MGLPWPDNRLAWHLRRLAREEEEEEGKRGKGVHFASSAKRNSGKAGKRRTSDTKMSEGFSRWHTNRLAEADLGEEGQEELLVPGDGGEWAPVDVFDYSSLVNNGCSHVLVSS